MTGEMNLPWINHRKDMKKAIDPRQLRSFGFIVGGIFAIIGLWPLINGHSPRYWALIIAALLVIPAAVWPKILLPVFRVWMLLGGILGEINSRIILTLIFFGVVTPIAVAKRWLGEDPLARATDRHARTYRKAREARPSSHMRRQY
jgi:hypothetical protein